MQKLSNQSKDISQENIKKVEELFPNCVTETYDQDGNLVRSIDFDILRQDLSGHVVEGQKERYQFNWPGKREAILLANAPTTNTLRPLPEKSVDFENTKNVYIEGDNLEALKILRETYMGKIDMIYIDPPYNTGNDFVYKDDFEESTTDFLNSSGSIDSSGNRLEVNSSFDGKFHSKWLKMMYSRLILARDFLTDDGIIFISIDDSEQAHLKVMCDEIFGNQNFVSNFIIDKTAQGANQSNTFKTQHEYCLLYKKNSASSINTNISTEIDASKYKYHDQKGYYAITNGFDSINSPLSKNKNRGYTVYYNPSTNDAIVQDEYDKTNDKFGPYNQDLIDKGYYPIRPGVRNNIQYPWNWEASRFLRDYRDELVIQKNKNGKYCIWHKNRFNGLTKDTTIKKFDTRHSGNQALVELVGAKVFDFPKSLEMMKWVISKTNNKNSLVMDFFSGSATTGQAVFELNQEDSGHRQFILIQIPEEIKESNEQINEFKTICDVGEKRLLKAGEELKNSQLLITSKLDTGFRVFKVDSSNMKEIAKKPLETQLSLLEDAESAIKENRTPLDLVIQTMLQLGITLDVSIEERKSIEGYEFYIVNSNDLICCFDKNVSETAIKEIARMQPLNVAFRDDSFATDQDEVNCEQIFKTLSPITGKNIFVL